jgi:outer membrane protein assembly factor BamA
VPLWAGSCLGTRYLEENQKLLYRQAVEVPLRFPKEGLADLPVQKPNRKFLGLPIHTLVWMHHEGLVRYQDSTSGSSKRAFEAKRTRIAQKFDRKIASGNDPRKISSYQFRKQKKIDAQNKKIENGNNFMQWGEPATIFDSAKTETSAENIHNFLFNKGYFKNEVTTRIQEFKRTRRLHVTYAVKPGQPYVIDSIQLNVADPAIDSILFLNRTSSRLRKGDIYTQANVTNERDRIETLLKDRGYYDFTRKYIDFDIDTAFREGRRIAIRINISNPPRKDAHKVFNIDSVSITVDAGMRMPPGSKRIASEYKHVTYNYFNDYYSERILNHRIFVHRDSLYSRANTFATQRQLANLDAFKFVNINYDTSQGRFIANIFTSPQDRYSWSNEAGVTVTQGFPGPYYSLSFKKRNIFRGLESFELNGRFGFEGVASFTQIGNIYRSTEANVTATITFPQIIFPVGERTATRLGKYNPRTRMVAGYTYTDRPEYTRSIFTLSNTFNWENGKRLQYSFTPTSLNIIETRFIGDLGAEFSDLLEQLQNEQGNNLINSFRPSFVGNMVFSVLWNPDNYGNNERSSKLLRAQFESGGTLFNFIEPRFATNRGLEVFQYVRANLDFRKNIVLNKHTALAYRVNSGIAYSYGANKTLPYEKFFFAGGSNSVRAWRPRRLGIGTLPNRLAANPEADGLFDYRFEKPGEIMLEGSVELRKKLFGFVNFAVFVDVGNVWNFSEAVIGQSSQLPEWAGERSTRFQTGANLWNQWGVGTGFGLRFDFTFLVLRLDAGIKAYDPAREVGDRFVLDRFKFFRPFGTNREPVIYNIGIGYPF